MGMYHNDRIVFDVKLASDVGWRAWQKDIAPFYRGFEVLVGMWKHSTETSDAANRSQQI